MTLSMFSAVAAWKLYNRPLWPVEARQGPVRPVAGVAAAEGLQHTRQQRTSTISSGAANGQTPGASAARHAGAEADQHWAGAQQRGRRSDGRDSIGSTWNTWQKGKHAGFFYLAPCPDNVGMHANIQGTPAHGMRYA